MVAQTSSSARPAWIALLIWFVAATGVGVSGLLARLPVPPPAIAGALTVLLLAALLASATLRMRMRAVGLRSFVAFHIVRIAAGAWFLVLSSRRVLQGEFAQVAGWGDIVVGIGAAIVWWLCFPLASTMQRRLLLLWNTLGLLDIVAVLANGARIFIRDPIRRRAVHAIAAGAFADVRRSEKGTGFAQAPASCARECPATGGEEGSPRRWNRKTGDVSFPAAFLCDAPAGEWLRHRDGTGVDRPQGRDHDDDLYPCVESAWHRRPPARFARDVLSRRCERQRAIQGAGAHRFPTIPRPGSLEASLPGPWHLCRRAP